VHGDETNDSLATVFIPFLIFLPSSLFCINAYKKCQCPSRRPPITDTADIPEEGISSVQLEAPSPVLSGIATTAVKIEKQRSSLTQDTTFAMV
jgi:hypothetical protein